MVLASNYSPGVPSRNPRGAYDGQGVRLRCISSQENSQEIRLLLYCSTFHVSGFPFAYDGLRHLEGLNTSTSC